LSAKGRDPDDRVIATAIGCVRPKLYAFSGDAGWMTSLGFRAYIEHLRGRFDFEVADFADSGRDTNRVVYDVVSQPPERMLVFLGYSLGANGCAWNQQMVRIYCEAHGGRVREIALLVGFDPTKNGAPLTNYPIERHVRRCLLFRQKAWWFPSSAIAGRGVYSRTEDGPKIETTEVHESHLTVQTDFKLQNICTAAILAEERTWSSMVA
jgi:hypothetical protein